MAKCDWTQISQKLQLGEIPPDDLSRILYECIEDLKRSQEAFSQLSTDVTSSITHLGDKVKERQEMADRETG